MNSSTNSAPRCSAQCHTFPACASQATLWSDSANPQSPAAEVYRTLATNLRYAAREHGIRSVLVTSAVRDEGKSTISANLAIALAQAGTEVLLISADLRRPSLHSFFGVPNDGIVDVVNGSKTLDEVMQDLSVGNLTFIGSGPAPRDPAALLGGHQAAQFVEEVRATNADFIVIDAPPTLAVADASILIPYTDAVLYVLNARSTTRLTLVQARDQLNNARASVIGGVYNNFNMDTNYPDYRHAYYLTEVCAAPFLPSRHHLARQDRGDWLA